MNKKITYFILKFFEALKFYSTPYLELKKRKCKKRKKKKTHKDTRCMEERL